MNKILILFAHPLYEKSRVHYALVKSLPQSDSITFHDLYESYPDFNIDIKFEQQLLIDHNIIIFQHPFYWYGVPSLIKQWIDMVLQYGWAYGPGGEALKDKVVFNAISTGGSETVYSSEGRNRFTIKEFLAPIEQTFKLCHMDYLPPFVIHGTHSLTSNQINEYAELYRRLLILLENDSFNIENYSNIKYLNEVVNQNSNK